MRIATQCKVAQDKVGQRSIRPRGAAHGRELRLAGRKTAELRVADQGRAAQGKEGSSMEAPENGRKSMATQLKAR